MKKFILLFQITLFTFLSHGQYNTPGTGVNWTMDSLRNNSNAISGNYPNFVINQDIVISLNDTLRVDSNLTIQFDNAIELEILGALQLTPKDSAIFTATNQSRLYDQIRIDGSSGSYISNTIFEYGGGLYVLNSDFTVENCTFRYNEASNDGAIDLFSSDLVIKNNHFHDNEGPAIKSGANIASAPQIINNLIERNVGNGSNQSQINFGATGTDTLMISGNTIKGYYANAGGVAIFPLGSANVIVDSNRIDSNRYGIALLNANINALINNNEITNNDIQGNPNLGGSGINLMGNNTVTADISRNIVSGNLWGITIQNSAKPNLGDLRPATYNVGLNEIFNNGNGGNEYNIYNNTPDSIYAQNNIWNYSTIQIVENTIFHETDDPTLGYVNYLPVAQLITSLKENINPNSTTELYPNPTNDVFTISADYRILKIEWYDLQGKLVRTDEIGSKVADLTEAALKGQFFLRLIGNQRSETKKVILR